MIKQFENFAIIEFDPNQGTSLFDLIDRNRLRLEDYFPGTVAVTRTLEDTLNYCKVIGQRINDKAYFPFIIINQIDNSYAGYIDIKSIDWKIPKAEVGYFVDHKYEGQGLVSKSLTFVLEYIKDKYAIKKILCRASPTNIGSNKVAIKNGFELEGTIRCDFKTANGEIVDMNYYGKILH